MNQFLGQRWIEWENTHNTIAPAWACLQIDDYKIENGRIVLLCTQPFQSRIDPIAVQQSAFWNNAFSGPNPVAPGSRGICVQSLPCWAKAELNVEFGQIIVPSIGDWVMSTVAVASGGTPHYGWPAIYYDEDGGRVLIGGAGAIGGCVDPGVTS